MHGPFIMAMLQIRPLRNFSVLDCGSHITYHRNKCNYRLTAFYISGSTVLAFKDTISYTNMQVTHTNIYIQMMFKYIFMHMKGEASEVGIYFLLQQDLMLYTFPLLIFHEREQSSNTIVRCPHGLFNLETHY